MRKVSAFATACVLASALFCGAALAGTVDHPFYLSAAGMVAWETGIDSKDVTNYDVGDLDFGAAWGFNVAAGYYFVDWFAVQVDYSYLPSPLDWEADTTINGKRYEADLSIMLNTYCLEAKFIAPPGDFPLRPYGVLGVGYMNTEITATLKTPGLVVREKETQNDLFGRAGLGGQLDLSNRVSMNLECDFNIGTGKSDYMKYVTLGLGVSVGL
ncbi:MAG: outer membrane beta-barrel protein [Thermodesulfobacteriota bacterium]